MLTEHLLTESQQQQIARKVSECLAVAEQQLGKPLAAIACRFDLRGRSAGMYVAKGDRRWLRFNPWLFSVAFEENLAETVPHEVAHYVVDSCFRTRGRRIRPHGAQWQQVMAWFGCAPTVTHRQSLEGIPVRRVTTVDYQCGCRSHSLSLIRHNRVVRGRARYLCRHCGGGLKQVLA